MTSYTVPRLLRFEHVSEMFQELNILISGWAESFLSVSAFSLFTHQKYVSKLCTYNEASERKNLTSEILNLILFMVKRMLSEVPSEYFDVVGVNLNEE